MMLINPRKGTMGANPERGNRRKNHHKMFLDDPRLVGDILPPQGDHDKLMN